MTDTKELIREVVGVKWCFVCRQRVEFVFTVTDSDPPSYAGPWPTIRCVPRNHVNGDLFPGWGREWE